MKLEICRNTEWLRENAGLDHSRLDESLLNEAADNLGSSIAGRLRDAGYAVEFARGQRVLYHGWNGANTFAHKLGPVGSFDRLSVDDEQAIEQAIADAIDETHLAFAA